MHLNANFVIKISLLTILMYSCGTNQTSESLQSIDQKDKRNDNWVWFVDAESNIGSWIPVGNETTLENGEYTLFYFNGNPRKKGKYLNGKDCDTIYFYDIGGKLHRKTIELDDSTYVFYREGKYQIHNPKGILIEEGEIKNNTHVGIYTEYYLNGNKSQTHSYDSTYITGEVLWWYKDGTIKAKEEFFKGKRNGFAEFFYRDGKQKWKISYSNGICHGLSEYWYETGIKESEYNYSSGVREGIAKSWHENGQLRSIIMYKNNVRNGPATYYFENGQKQSEGLFVADKRKGEWTEWDENGNQVLQVSF